MGDTKLWLPANATLRSMLLYSFDWKNSSQLFTSWPSSSQVDDDLPSFMREKNVLAAIMCGLFKRFLHLYCTRLY
jgi:hypothetical protein